MAHRKVYVSNWDEALDAVNGKEYVLDGIHGHLKVTRSIDRFGLPVTSFVHEPSRKGKTSEAYLERRRELGDDWHTDFRDSERAGTIASEFCEFPATDAERAGFTQRKKTDKAFPIGARVITRTGNRRGTVVNLFPMREVTDGFPYRATPDTVAVQWDNGSKGFDHRLDLVLEKADSSRHPNTRKAPERKFWTLTKAPMSKGGAVSAAIRRSTVRKAVIILGRDGMGEASAEDFDSWVAYVTDRIDQLTGLDVLVNERSPREVQDDYIRVEGTADSDPAADKAMVREALCSLWESFCADGAPARSD